MGSVHRQCTDENWMTLLIYKTFFLFMDSEIWGWKFVIKSFELSLKFGINYFAHTFCINPFFGKSKRKRKEIFEILLPWLRNHFLTLLRLAATVLARLVQIRTYFAITFLFTINHLILICHTSLKRLNYDHYCKLCHFLIFHIQKKSTKA